MSPPTPTITSNIFTHNSRTTHYLTCGPPTGPLIILVHGWPAMAITWKAQLHALSTAGYLCAAADTHGYGRSSNSAATTAFSLESLVSDQLALLSHLNRRTAIWIGHDWGSPIVWAVAAHHPSACTAVASMCVPYHTIEFGLVDGLLPTINRDIYPADQYPNGQWDYQVFYEQEPDRSTALFDADVGATVRFLYAKGSPAGTGKPFLTAEIVKNGGWFPGGAERAPAGIPLEVTVLDEEMWENLTEALGRQGFSGPTKYYLNHGVNREYSQGVKEKVLEMPVLFIEATWDHVCATADSELAAPMRRLCADLREVSVEAGHWVALEKPEEVNQALLKWLREKVKQE